MSLIPALYLSIALYCFANWFKVFNKYTDLSPEEKRLSWLVLFVATLLWPIAVPISHLEKRRKTEPEEMPSDFCTPASHEESAQDVEFVEK